MNQHTFQFENRLYEDSAWKENFLSKLEIMFDDSRNNGMSELNDKLDNLLEYGKNYLISFTVSEIP